MFVKTQQAPTVQVIVEIIDWPGASPVKALITTLGPAGLLPNVLRPSVGIGAQFTSCWLLQFARYRVPSL